MNKSKQLFHIPRGGQIDREVKENTPASIGFQMINKMP